MLPEIQIPEGLSVIKDKSKRINDVAKKIDAKRHEWQIWKNFDPSYELSSDLYEWRNNLDREFPQAVEKHLKQTPATYNLDRITYGHIVDGDNVTVTFKYGFSVLAKGERINVDFETEGIMAVLDKEVESAKIEIIDKDSMPILHLPVGWTFLFAHPTKRMHMRTHGYAKWQPELTQSIRRIKFPDDLQMTFVYDDPDKAQIYTDTQVLS